MIPYAEEGISAGFPSPAEDFIEQALDLNKVVVKNPVSTFFGRIKGNSLEGIFLYDGDIIVIDKSLTPKNNELIVCIIDGEFTAKFYYKKDNIIYLKPANKDYPIIELSENGQEARIWGKVTWSFRNMQNAAKTFKDWELSNKAYD